MPVLSVVVVVVSVVPFGAVATVVEDVDVCPKAIVEVRAVANATLSNDLIMIDLLIIKSLQ